MNVDYPEVPMPASLAARSVEEIWRQVVACHREDWVVGVEHREDGFGMYADDRREMMTDYERGVQAGKQIALGWVLGEEWDEEDK